MTADNSECGGDAPAERKQANGGNGVVPDDRQVAAKNPNPEPTANGNHTPQIKLSATQNSVDKAITLTKESQGDCDRRCGWCERLVGGQCGLSDSWGLHILGLVLLIALSWAALSTVLYVEVAPGGDLFKLLVLILVAYFAGRLAAMVRLPPLLGMLVAGIILRTVGFFKISGVYLDIVIKLREIALTVILIKAGLGLDAASLLKLSLVVLRLSFFPCIAEAAAAAVIAHYVMGYPWLWGLLMGFMLSAVSPAVVVPVLLSLQDQGYGEEKGIATLVIAASSLDDVLAISAFGIFLGVLFSPGDLTHQLLQGPTEMAIGFAFGITWGLIAAFIPHRDDKNVTFKRSTIIGIGGLTAVLGSEILHYPGAGPLACIVEVFVANLCWKLQGWEAYNPVTKVFSNVWLIVQPILFGLIGAEIDVLQIELDTIGFGMAVILGSLVIRIVTCYLVLIGGKLNWKELIFVNLAWLPKATVQAALGPVALDEVRRQDNPSPDDARRGAQILTIAVLSILFTAPIGSIGISVTGPYLLAKAEPRPPKKDTVAKLGESGVRVEETQLESQRSDTNIV